MFPTFTGTSRRPRNVNLGGQRTNPFAAHGLTPLAGKGASRTVAEALAGRRQRQQERDELRAAQTIQRVWRGHRSRTSVKASRRQSLTELYGAGSSEQLEQRASVAFPLLISTFDVRREDDRLVLAKFTNDLVQSDFRPLASGQLPPGRLWRLVRILVSTLDRDAQSAASLSDTLELLVRTIHKHPRALLNSLGPYFRMLAHLCGPETDWQKGNVDVLQRTILSPLTVANDAPESLLRRAYFEFASSFLTRPVDFFERRVAHFSEHINPNILCEEVVGLYRTPKGRPGKSSEELLWLLAHTIALGKGSTEQTYTSSLYLRVVYTQLSALSSDIRLLLPSSKDVSSHTVQPPAYVVDQLLALVQKDEIMWLLDKISSSQVNTVKQEYISLLAGYIIVLLRCFPSKADDIRMRLFLSRLPTESGTQPAVQYFWAASSATKLFDRILRSPKGALDFLLQRNYFRPSSAASEDDSPWHREWRIVLLFLELYTFVLRLTDDEDFFSVFEADVSSLTTPAHTSSSQLRLSALPLDALKRLTSFLKNLSFTLHYNATELLRDDAKDSDKQDSLSGQARLGRHSGTYQVIPGLDFGTFKATVTTAIRMLYERDSRRQFLPPGHWLMTSNFEMDDFVAAVALEEQRRHELDDGEDSSDDGMDVDDADSDDDVDDGGAGSYFRTARPRSRYALHEQLRKMHKRAQRERMMAAVGPKLEVLRNMPFVLPFEIRVQIFRKFVELDQFRRRGGHIDPDQWRMHVFSRHGGAWDATGPARDIVARHSARITRDSVFESAFSKFWELGEGLKEPIQITFVDEFGNDEAGIDGGGVTKEFLISATKEKLSSQNDMFQANRENALFPNPVAMDQLKDTLRAAGVAETDEEWRQQLTDLMNHYEFMGRIVGKCLYEGILIDVAFARFFLLKWSSAADAASRASINDLREMDEELYQGMMQLKNYAGDVAELDLDFTIEDQVSESGAPMRTVTRNLIPNGRNVRVTNENRPLYISYVARHRLVMQPYAVTKAFLHGLGAIIDPGWLRMFNQNELQRLVGGDSSEIDVEDLRRNTSYSGVYEVGDDGEEHPTVQLFWDVVRSLADEDRRLLLKYVTSTPRAPLLGFSQLKPGFSIRDSGTDQTRLPSAATCVNLLKLPQYRSADTLRDKLLYAIQSNSRFDLS